MNDSRVSQFKLNIPAVLKEQLSEAAAHSGRSLSSEIITRLEASISISDEGGIDFTLSGIEAFIHQAIEDAVTDLEGRVRSLEAKANQP